MPMLITRVDSSKPPMKLQGLRGVNPSIYLGLTIANVASFHAIKFHSLLPRALSSPIIFLFYCYIRGTRGAAVFSETSNRPEKHRGGGVSFAWEMEGRKEGRKRVVERRSKWLFWKKVGILFFFFRYTSSSRFLSSWFVRVRLGWVAARSKIGRRKIFSSNKTKSREWFGFD